MKPSGVMPANPAGAGTTLDRVPKKKRMASTKTMPRPKVTRIWSSYGRE